MNSITIKIEGDNIHATVAENGLQLKVNDRLKTFSITTPGGNTVIFSEKKKSLSMNDAWGNKIEMNASGISMNSIQDINLNAKGKVNILAGGDVTTKSVGNIRTEGTNIVTAAGGFLKAEGHQGTEVSSFAVTTIKGTLVKIN